MNGPNIGSTKRLLKGVIESVEYGEKAGVVEETRGLGDNGWTRGEVEGKDGAGVVEDEEGAWEGRLCKKIGRERVDVRVV